MNSLALKFADDYIFYYIISSLFSIWMIRSSVFELLIGSIPGKYSAALKKAKAIRSEQSFIGKMRMSYVGEHISEMLRTPFKIFVVFRLGFDLFVLGSGILILLCNICDKLFESADLICGYSGLISTFFAVALFLQYNPLTKSTRFIDFKFPNR